MCVLLALKLSGVRLQEAPLKFLFFSIILTWIVTHNCDTVNPVAPNWKKEKMNHNLHSNASASKHIVTDLPEPWRLTIHWFSLILISNICNHLIPAPHFCSHSTVHFLAFLHYPCWEKWFQTPQAKYNFSFFLYFTGCCGFYFSSLCLAYHSLDFLSSC